MVALTAEGPHTISGVSVPTYDRIPATGESSTLGSATSTAHTKRCTSTA
jgi:hypothetical protein